MALETHGRWPVAGAVALGPVTAAAVRKPALRPLAALLWHQTEEWFWPGGFLPWINREVFGSQEDEFPIDRRTGFVVNVVFGWGFSAAAGAGAPAASAAALLYTDHLGNAALHLSWAIRHRRYDPGTVTSVLTLLGVVIGVGAVIAVVTFVSGINDYVAKKIFNLGADVFIISKMSAVETNVDKFLEAEKRKNIDMDDYQAVRDACQRCAIARRIIFTIVDLSPRSLRNRNVL